MTQCRCLCSFSLLFCMTTSTSRQVLHGFIAAGGRSPCSGDGAGATSTRSMASPLTGEAAAFYLCLFFALAVVRACVIRGPCSGAGAGATSTRSMALPLTGEAAAFCLCRCFLPVSFFCDDSSCARLWGQSKSGTWFPTHRGVAKEREFKFEVVL